MDDDLMTVQEVAKELGVTASRVNQLRQEQRITGERYGVNYLYRRVEVERYKAQPKGKPGRKSKGAA